MKNSLKALLAATFVSCIMIGCESTQSRDCDGQSCGTAQCDPANCDGKDCDKESCPMGEACKDGQKAGACGDDCKKACCSDKMTCSHKNTTFSCPNCVDGKFCCAGCEAKAAAACPDC